MLRGIGETRSVLAAPQPPPQLSKKTRLSKQRTMNASSKKRPRSPAASASACSRPLSFPVSTWTPSAAPPPRVQVSLPTELACSTRDSRRAWHPGSRAGLPRLRPGLASLLPMDLNGGFFEFVDQEDEAFGPDSLDVVLSALSSRGCPVKRPDVVTWRGCLTKLARRLTNCRTCDH